LRGRCGATARSSLYKMKAKEPKTKPDKAILAADSDRERSHSPVMLSAIHTPDIEPHDANSNSQQYLSMRSIRRCDMRVLPHHAGRLLLYHRAVHRAIIAARCPAIRLGNSIAIRIQHEYCRCRGEKKRKQFFMECRVHCRHRFGNKHALAMVTYLRRR
jgi:hypothetical protein